jgi:UDPglucose--hexose-1-phosphate uridylyltransferase
MPIKKRSELREDPVSGDWILLARGRAKWRGSQAWKHRAPRKRAPVANCPFEQPLETHKSVLVYEGKGGWQVAVVHNKFPAVMEHGACGELTRRGFYTVAEGVGVHNLILTRDHDRNFPKLPAAQAAQVFEAFRDRYIGIAENPCVAYVSMFHNWGPTAGASVYHPHYQIIAIPVVPPDVMHSLHGSTLFYKKHHRCVHCEMLKHERKERKRIVFENKGAIVFAPFVSREAFELRVFPKRHSPYFENTLDTDLNDVSAALQEALRRLEKKLRDPDYNFFIHTAPLKDKAKYGHYHWHIEVVPKTNIDAGFELETGIEVNTTDPDEAAKILRSR